MSSNNFHSHGVVTRMEAMRPTVVKQRISTRMAQFMASRRFVRYGLVTLNVLLLVGIAWFTLGPTHQGRPLGRQGVVAGVGSNAATEPLDILSSADIAEQAAVAAGLAESVAVVNQADSVNAELAIAPASTTVVTKPQQVATPFKSRRDIQTYVTVKGDTVSALAAKFSVTSDSIMWSNGLRGNVLTPGVTLFFPPAGTQGIVYTVLAGDTIDSLARKFQADKNYILDFNDIELTGLKVGDRILIPNGRQPAPAVIFLASIGGSNGYIRGWCTWYAASRAGVPPNWGNANTWDNSARAAGWTVSKVPIKGAVAQTDRSNPLGHVGIVEDVSSDGTMIKYSDMNGLAGFNRVGYSDWVPVSRFENYIYR